MEQIRISTNLRDIIEEMFSEDLWIPVIMLLEAECGCNLPLVDKHDLAGIERIRCAVLKVCKGSFAELRIAVDLANIDWRDVLVAAGFATSVTAHKDWLRASCHH